MTEPTIRLTEEQIDFYHREGFLTLPAITTADEVQWLRGIYDRLFENRAGRDRGDQFDLGGADEDGKTAVLPQILGPSNYEPELKQGLFRVNALSVARQLLGDKADYQGEHAILKPALIGAPTPWHQDEAYWNPDYDYNAMSIWVPLQDATLENGCMQFLPRSHRMEVQPHHSIGHDPRVHGLEADSIDTSSAVPCPITAGGATIHHNRMFHYAGPNRSTAPRRAYILGFGLPATKRGATRDFYWNRMKQTPREARARATAPDATQPFVIPSDAKA